MKWHLLTFPPSIRMTAYQPLIRTHHNIFSTFWKSKQKMSIFYLSFLDFRFQTVDSFLYFRRATWLKQGPLYRSHEKWYCLVLEEVDGSLFQQTRSRLFDKPVHAFRHAARRAACRRILGPLVCRIREEVCRRCEQVCRSC